jgi:hypothetical protein
MEHIAVGVVERGHCRERERIRSTAMYEPLRIATGVGGALVVKITFRFMLPLATNPQQRLVPDVTNDAHVLHRGKQ